jgi:hypothetical protein
MLVFCSSGLVMHSKVPYKAHLSASYISVFLLLNIQASMPFFVFPEGKVPQNIRVTYLN